jgi:S-adenosylmethionine hydrolase
VPSPPDTVFFLSDYGTRDEFAGVVRAVLRRLAPHATVVDLTHDVPPFDVVSGARSLERAVPHLGDGVVLAVVDPGVGSDRRGIAFEVEGAAHRRFFVGPDNGLLPDAAEAAGDHIEAVLLRRPDAPGASATFDGRDLFAPAVAALCNGSELRDLGPTLDPSLLVRLTPPVSRRTTLTDGRVVRWCEIIWVDRFGNLQLNAAPGDLVGPVELRFYRDDAAAPDAPVERVLRRVTTFAHLASGEPGMIVDANGLLALVVREGSASELLGVGVGQVVGLTEVR